MEKGASDLLRTAVTTVLGALFGLGFVAVIGGGVLLARFRGAGLPSEVAVSIQPKATLLAVGGENLALFILCGLVAAMVVTVAAVRPDEARVLGILFWVIAAVEVAAFGFAVHEAFTAFLTWAALVVLAVLALLEAHTFRVVAGELRPEGSGKRLTARLAALEALVFAGIVVYGAAAVVGASYLNPHIRPATFTYGGAHQCGIYVGETSDRVYVGEMALGADDRPIHSHSRLVVFPRAKIAALSIGGGQPAKDAIVAADTEANGGAPGAQAAADGCMRTAVAAVLG